MMRTRRDFMRASMATGAMIASKDALSQGATTDAVDGDAPMYDMVVVGAGTAGTIAAIQAGRLGMRTLLVEKNGMPGGTTTVASVNFPGLFHAWGKLVIAGIGWELVTQAVALCGETLPDFTQIPDRHWQHQVRVNRAVYTALLCEALQQANVEVLFHAMPATASDQPESANLALCTKTGLKSVRAHFVIDATGDANVTALMGFPLVEHDIRQPGTLICTLDGYDYNALDTRRINNAFDQAVEKGELHPEDKVFVRNNVLNFLATHGDNSTHMPNVDGRTSAGRSAAELNSRIALLRVFRFLRSQPGLEQLEITFLAAECGIRETVTIQGEDTVTHNDYWGGKLWEDAVCYSFYPIDLHLPQGGGIDTRPLAPGTTPTIPRGALVPKGSRRLLAAGRCLSSDREANSALRVQATCMACGQAAAALAAQAIREQTNVMSVDMNQVRNTLKNHNAIIPGWG